MPVGIDIGAADAGGAPGRGHHRARRPADDGDAREIKSPDEITLLNTACAMVDGAYQLIAERLKPGIRESQLVADVTKALFDMGSEHVDNINAVSGERCSRHPHVFSDRLIRPGDQAFFDIIQTYIGYKTCYYRTFVVGMASDAQRDAYKQARAWIDASIELMTPGRSTDEVARVWPRAQDFGFDNEMEFFGLQFGHGVGLFLHERPIISRLNSLDHPDKIRKAGHRPQTSPARTALGGAIEEEVVVTTGTTGDRRPSTELFVANPTTMAAVSAAPPDLDLRLRMYRTMVECRFFEQRAQELFFEGLVRGTTHLGIGQEAVAAGFSAAMRDDDYTFATYRGHNHALARGAPMGPLYAELFGRAGGLMGGKGGSMHITDVSHNMMGSYAIVGAHLPTPPARHGLPSTAGRARSRSASATGPRTWRLPRDLNWPWSGSCRSYSSQVATIHGTRRSRRSRPWRAGCRPRRRTG
jgi:hypothetical protein